MKKISILIIAIALLAITLPVMAQVTISGELKNGFTLSQAEGQDNATVGEKVDGKLTFKAAPDANSSVEIVAKFLTVFNTITQNATTKDITQTPSAYIYTLDKAAFTLKILEAAGLTDLPVSITLTSGWFEWGNNDFGKVDAYEVSDVVDLKDKDFGFQADIAIMKMVTVRLGIQPDFAFNTFDTTATPNLMPFIAGAFGTFGPISAELYYTNAEATEAASNGSLGVGVGFSMDVVKDFNLKAGADMQIDLLDPDAKISYGAGVAATYTKLIKATVGIEGYVQGDVTTNAVRTLAISAESTPIPLITVVAGTALALYDGALSTLDKIEGMVKFNLGKAYIATGYVYMPVDANSSKLGYKGDLTSWVNPALGGTGGWFINTYLSF